MAKQFVYEVGIFLPFLVIFHIKIFALKNWAEINVYISNWHKGINGNFSVLFRATLPKKLKVK
jgi:hypothetical protein